MVRVLWLSSVLSLLLVACGGDETSGVAQDPVGPFDGETFMETDQGGDGALGLDESYTDTKHGDAPSPETDLVNDSIEDTSPSLDGDSEVNADSGPDLVAALDTAADLTEEDCGPCGPSEATASLALQSSDLIANLERTQGNPLKGFITSYLWGEPGNDLPDSMEFLYLPMKEVWGPSGQTFDSGLEPLLDAAAGRGHHVVLRVYIDYPAKESGLPDYIMEAKGCTPYPEHGGGCSPDYDDPVLLDAILGLIDALGIQYDGDPRLGALQIGLLGFWGEWHTYPHTDLFPSLQTQNAVLHGAHEAFETTAIQVRYPHADSVGLRIGFHDDSFAHSTLGEIGWFFWPSMVSAGADTRWEEVMMGGEVRPELQSNLFEESYTLGEYAQDLQTCVDTIHASYLLNYKAFSENGIGYSGDSLQKAKAASLHMGYTFEVTAASLHLSKLFQESVVAQVHVELAQTGVAPFYYALHPSVGAPGEPPLESSDEDLSTLLPGEKRQVVFDLGEIALENVLGPLEFRLSSPMLQSGQAVRLGTQTPWTLPEGPLTLHWSPICETTDGPIPLGELWPQPGEGGCPFRCDVDGIVRACDGAACPNQ